MSTLVRTDLKNDENMANFLAAKNAFTSEVLKIADMADSEEKSNLIAGLRRHHKHFKSLKTMERESSDLKEFIKDLDESDE